jgi:hypothetical protein
VTELALSKGPNRIGVFPHLRTETDPVSEMLCFFFVIYEKSGRWTKSENPISLCVIHHRQNPIVSTYPFLIQFPLYPISSIITMFWNTGNLAIRRVNLGLGSMVIHLSCSRCLEQIINLPVTDRQSFCDSSSIHRNARTLRIPVNFIFTYSVSGLFNDVHTTGKCRGTGWTTNWKVVERGVKGNVIPGLN